MLSRTRQAVIALAFLLSAFGFGTSFATAAPANDNFASAQLMTGAPPLTVAGNNVGATVEPGEPTIFSNTPLRTVWYRWTATSTAIFVLDTCNDGFTGGPDYANPMLGIRTGTTVGTLVNVAETNGPCSLRFSATVGTTYNFQIDYHDLEGNFNLTLRPLTPPANDNFASATPVGPALPFAAEGTTVDSTYQAGEPASLGGSSNSRSVWFNWTAPTTQRVRLTLCDKELVDGPLNDSTYVFTGSTVGTLVAVANTTSNDCNVDFPATAGTTYRIGVSGSNKGEFTFQLKMQAAPPPANDDFASAQVIGPGLPVDLSGNNDFATEEAGEPDDHGDYSGGTSRSVWYSWTAAVSGPMRLKTCSRELRFFTSVYTGNTLAGLTEVSENSDWTECSRYFDAVAGTTYRIAVAGGPFEDSHGPFALNLHQVSLPVNDASSSAIELGSGVAISKQGTTVDATTEENEPNHAYSGSTGGSVWYRWTAPNDNPVVMSACSQLESNRITVYDEEPEPEEWQTGLYRLRQLDFDNELCRGGEKGGRLAIAPEKGRQYWIVVTPSVEDYESAFNLKIQGTADVVTPKPPAFNLKKAIAKCKKTKGQGAKAKRKRANCIKAAKKKAAIIKCKKLQNTKKRNVCIRKARKKFR